MFRYINTNKYGKISNLFFYTDCKNSPKTTNKRQLKGF